MQLGHISYLDNVSSLLLLETICFSSDREYLPACPLEVASVAVSDEVIGSMEEHDCLAEMMGGALVHLKSQIARTLAAVFEHCRTNRKYINAARKNA